MQLMGTIDGMEPVVEQDKRPPRIVQISWGRIEVEGLGTETDVSGALAVSAGTGCALIWPGSGYRR